MKKTLCILLAAMFVFSALGMTAFAASQTELVTETETEALPQSDGSLVQYSVREYTTGGVEIIISQGETVKLNYLEMDYHSNVPVPKGGRIEWRYLTGGGEVKCTVSGDKKSCSVTGVSGGCVTVGAYVFDKNGNQLSYSGENFRVRYTGFLEILDTITLEAISLCRLAYNLFLHYIGQNPEVKIG